MKWQERDMAKVERLITKWRNHFFINQWDLTIGYERKNKNDTLILEVTPDSVYRKAYISVYPNYLEVKNKEKPIIHELIHCVLSPMNEISGDLLDGKLVTNLERSNMFELVTEHVTTIIHALDTRKEHKMPSHTATKRAKLTTKFKKAKKKKATRKKKSKK